MEVLHESSPNPTGTVATESSFTPTPGAAVVFTLSFLTELSILSICINALCFVTGISILFVRKHSYQMMVVLGPLVPGLLSAAAVAEIVSSSGVLKTTVLMILAGLGVTTSMWISFYFLPCVGAATFLSFLLLTMCLVLEAAIGVDAGVLALVVPIFCSIVAVLVVYSVSRIPVIRNKDFEWTDSASLHFLHIFITCLAASFGVVTSLMFFIDSTRTSLMSLSHAVLESYDPVDSNKAALGIGVWTATFFLFLCSRSLLFDSSMRWLWSKIRRHKKQGDTVSLIHDRDCKPDATEFGLKLGDETERKTISTLSVNSYSS